MLHMVCHNCLVDKIVHLQGQQVDKMVQPWPFDEGLLSLVHPKVLYL